jgi:hypothetical protein
VPWQDTAALGLVFAWLLARAGGPVKHGHLPSARQIASQVRLVVVVTAAIAGWLKWLMAEPGSCIGETGLLQLSRVRFRQTMALGLCTDVMDTSDPEIAFDEHGYCNHCTAFHERPVRGAYRGAESQKQLEALIRKIRDSGRGQPYDSVIGISGGLDSTYTAILAKGSGLRPLAVHMDNGWDSTTAVTNIKNLMGTLGLDYQSHVLDWEEFRDLQLAFFRASVPEIETPTDMAIAPALHEVAAQNRVKYIISGSNAATEGILPKSWHYDVRDVKYLKAIHRAFGTRNLRTFPTFGFQTEIYYKFAKGIRFVYLLNYVPYSRKEAMRTVEQAGIGWTSTSANTTVPIPVHSPRFAEIHRLPPRNPLDTDLRRRDFERGSAGGAEAPSL